MSKLRTLTATTGPIDQQARTPSIRDTRIPLPSATDAAIW
jgi:hypothetical protein